MDISKFTIDYLREFYDKIEWDYVSMNCKLSQSTIREFQNYVDWDYISSNQTLSEDFIREFKNKVNWELIGINQKLTEKFIREFNNKLYMKMKLEFGFNCENNNIPLEYIKIKTYHNIIIETKDFNDRNEYFYDETFVGGSDIDVAKLNKTFFPEIKKRYGDDFYNNNFMKHKLTFNCKITSGNWYGAVFFTLVCNYDKFPIKFSNDKDIMQEIALYSCENFINSCNINKWNKINYISNKLYENNGQYDKNKRNMYLFDKLYCLMKRKKYNMFDERNKLIHGKFKNDMLIKFTI